MSIPIVNKKDEIIAYKDRSEIDYNNDIFRTSGLWVTNSAGDVLLAQRKFDKKIDAGRWGEAVGGTVEDDDSYYDTIIREANEELGLKDINIIEGPKQFIGSPYRAFIQWFIITIDKPIDEFKFQVEEVEQIAWVPIKQLYDDLANNPEKYVTDFDEVLKLIYNHNV